VFVVEVDSVEDLGVSPANEARDSLGIPSSPLLSHAHMYTRTPSPLHTHTERERERERHEFVRADKRARARSLGEKILPFSWHRDLGQAKTQA